VTELPVSFFQTDRVRHWNSLQDQQIAETFTVESGMTCQQALEVNTCCLLFGTRPDVKQTKNMKPAFRLRGIPSQYSVLCSLTASGIYRTVWLQ